MSNTQTKNIYKQGKTYRIIKRINGKNIFFGSFKTLEEAQQERKQLIQNNWNNTTTTNNDQYITYDNGAYTIRKTVKGKRQYYGRYPTIEKAREVRNHLIKHNWNMGERPRNPQYHPKGLKNIYKTKQGKWIIKNGKGSYGTYKTLSECKDERDILEKYNYDYDIICESIDNRVEEYTVFNNRIMEIEYTGVKHMVEIEDTKCKQCEECKEYVYQRKSKKGDLIIFQYCEMGKHIMELSNWYIKSNDGYIYSTSPINGKKRLFHTFFKKDKTKIIDHINGIRSDNRLSNLREVTDIVNSHNLHLKKKSSKFPGVYWNKKTDKYYSQTRVGKQGKPFKESFDTPVEAYHHYVTFNRDVLGREVDKTHPAYKDYQKWLDNRCQTTLI